MPGENSVPHLIRTVRRPDAVWRARVVVLTTFIVAGACDQWPDALPTSPSIANRTASHGTVVSASVVTLPTLGGVSTSPVDINPSTVIKLADRGSFQTVGLVTDVEPFLRELVNQLSGS